MKILVALLALILIPVAARCAELPEQVLAEINFARTSPQQYAQIVAAYAATVRLQEGPGIVRETVRFLEKQQPLAPLANSNGIRQSALSHVADIGPGGARGHKGSDGSWPWDRIARYGQYMGGAAENIDYGRHGAREIVIRMVMDDGVKSRGHRKNIFNRDYRVAGAAAGFHGVYGAMCVVDFAGGFVEGADRVATRAAMRVSPL